jgi:hypothetical protein
LRHYAPGCVGAGNTPFSDKKISGETAHPDPANADEVGMGRGYFFLRGEAHAYGYDYTATLEIVRISPLRKESI